MVMAVDSGGGGRYDQCGGGSGGGYGGVLMPKVLHYKISSYFQRTNSSKKSRLQ